MVNPGMFGSRRTFLDSQTDLYAAAVAEDHVADTVADIQRRFFKRYPIDLPPKQEPTAEWLAQVDDMAPEPEIATPDPDTMNPAVYHLAEQEHDDLLKNIKLRKDQIKRRLAYQYNKARDERSSFEKGSSDPLALLAAKLTGETIKRPRMKTAYNLWGPENRPLVDPIFQQRVMEGNIPVKQQAALRSSVYKELFGELEDDEQNIWTARTEREHRDALATIEKHLHAPPSTSPEDRQRIIQALPKFIEPILDLIAEHSGWKVTMIAGGPEPADSGRLNMISIHSGVTTGSVRMDFGKSERKSYRSNVVVTFGKFLKKCYSIEECRSRALPTGHSAIGLAAVGVEEDVDVHRFDLDPQHIQLTSNIGKDSQKGNSAASVTQPAIRLGPPMGRKIALRPLPVSTTTKRLSPAPAANSSSPLHADVANQPRGEVAIDPETSNAQTSQTPSQIPPSSVHSLPPSRAPSPAYSPPPSRAPSPPFSVSLASAMPLGHCQPSARAPVPLPTQCPPPALATLTPPSKCQVPIPVPVNLPDPCQLPALARVNSPAHCPTSVPVQVHSPVECPLPALASTASPSQCQNPVPALVDSPVHCHPSVSAASPALLRAPPRSPPWPAPHVTSFQSFWQAPSQLLSQTHSPPSEFPAPPSDSSAASDVCPSRSISTPVLTSNPATTSLSRSPSDPPVIPISRSLRSSAVPTPSPALGLSCQLPASTNVPINKPCTTSKPPGAATVPEPSSIAALSTKSRKRKLGEENKGADGAESRGGKRTRSSAVTSAGQRKHAGEGGPAKKHPGHADAADTSIRAFDVAAPAECPPWIVKVLNLVAAVELGAAWQNLVRTWLEFESHYGFQQDGKNLGSQGRPRIVSDWIRRARNSKYRPSIQNIGVFEADFKSWWASVQPGWRVNKGSGVALLRRSGDWDALKCSGQNGIVSVIAALCFWGLEMESGSQSKEVWDAIVDDVLYALINLSKSM